MNKVTHESLTQGPPAPVAPTSASIGAAALAAQTRRTAQANGHSDDLTEDGTAISEAGTSETGGDKPPQTAEAPSDRHSDRHMESATDSTDKNGPDQHPDQNPADPGQMEADQTDTSPTDTGSAGSALAPDDLEQLAAHLRGGPQPLGTRGDLIELHKRITGMFATLNEGLGEMYTRKADADRKVLSARMDTLEEAVNRMEGALRIELEPVLRDSFAKVLAKDRATRRRSLGQRLKRGITTGSGLALILALGLAAGTLYHSRIATTSDTAWSAAQIHWASFVDFVETTTADPGQLLNNTSE
ncbi:hypothetical protein PhaeoP23_03921 (plasmid) [Phaeobacter piscinae]|uniref:Uncharacterized protein n=1 Tax=Phaeobacter piscinae TaxID=1580596 RepID=A0ABM6PJP8_9RHOB|nr:hypothetical protein [Phaeobacter piscinae]ATG38074.1 hypothetical protein PhaeoP36_03999 [Phaeobacter piscinae]AUQ88595.1 hypothetical protein PhaeoP42_04000 [Phaeobacter piscinae]AUR26400.1 hypothetical protein PhaeoP23_03921 [Phaeobacter piscinae]